nr:Chain C, EBI96 Coactivator Peptide [synthetic construct]5EJV_D Chain D, EBI96 Coactivator Peptide [synthetic construct]
VESEFPYLLSLLGEVSPQP